ncbi:MAG: hypothetical protein R2849_11915 [Thermomicrobiales bacterium]
MRYAAGNPFYTTELLATLEQQGFIQNRGNGYEIGQLHDAVIPPIVQQLVQTRIAGADDSLRHTFRAAAALGERFSYDDWLQLCGAGEGDLEDAIAAGTEARIFAPALNRATMAFSHALIQETIYQTIPPGERRDLHRRIAAMLIDQPVPDPDAIAHHLSQCDAPEAIDWLMKAGDRAYASHAWVVARERFREALTRLDTQPADPERRAWLLYRLALAERWEEDLEAVALLDEASSIAEKLR